MMKLLGISGSLRRESHNAAILRTIADRLPLGTELTVFSLEGLPFYNQDVEAQGPEIAVELFRQAIAASDGLVIATPEYNYGIPGVLKNALDWASRPYGAATLTGKPVMTLSSSPAFTGGVRAQSQLHDTLLSIGAIIHRQPQIVIGSVHQKVVSGRITDGDTLALLDKAIHSFAAALP